MDQQMKFIASKGLRALFVAELTIAGLSILMATGLLGVFAAGFAGLVVIVFRLKGLMSLRLVRPEYRAAYRVVLAEIGLSLIGSLAMSIALIAGFGYSIIMLLVSIVSGIMGYLMVRLVCVGTQNLLEQLHNTSLYDQGERARILVLIVTVLVIATNLLGSFLDGSLVGFLDILANVLNAAAFAIYARFLRESDKALSSIA